MSYSLHLSFVIIYRSIFYNFFYVHECSLSGAMLCMVLKDLVTFFLAISCYESKNGARAL